MIRVEFDPEGTEPTNEPPCLAIISNLFIFNNFLIPTTIQSTLIIFDHVTSRRFHDRLITDGPADVFDAHNRNRWF